MDNNKVIKLNDKSQYDAWNRTHETEKMKIVKSKISKDSKRSRVQAKVSPMLAKWQYTKPNKPCLFVARYNEKDGNPSLHYAGYDDGILCVSDVEENFISTMEDYADCQYFIIEYI